MDCKTYKRILYLLEQEVKPALGCTEPVAVALAVARAREVFPDDEVKSVEVNVSANILKNAMGVGIPGTHLAGLPVASALAVVCGRSEYGLEVLKAVDDNAVEKACRLVDEKKVGIGLADTDEMLYVCAECHFGSGHASTAVISGAHDHFTSILADGVPTNGSDGPAGASGTAEEEDGKFLSLSLINEFANCVRLQHLSLIEEQIDMNLALAEEGLKGSWGLNVGKTIASSEHSAIFGDNLCAKCMSLTAAASDARMSGSKLPAMSNSGSGNQGLTVSLPVIATAQHLGSSREELVRALVVSNLVAIHIKSYLGKLSALCGCVVASTGSSCGIIRLKGGDIVQMAAAIKNMVGGITGMVCDGAKEGCALKVASGVSCAVQSAILALDGMCVHSTDGIIDDDVEKTIRNLGQIGSQGMKQTDRMILDIMVCK